MFLNIMKEEWIEVIEKRVKHIILLIENNQNLQQTTIPIEKSKNTIKKYIFLKQSITLK